MKYALEAVEKGERVSTEQRSFHILHSMINLVEKLPRMQDLVLNLI